jgi:hypothetical protein
MLKCELKARIISPSAITFLLFDNSVSLGLHREIYAQQIDVHVQQLERVLETSHLCHRTPR